MNWQIIVGIIFLIGGIGNITNSFSSFLTAIAIGSILLFLGIRKKKRKADEKAKVYQPIFDDIDRQIETKQAERQIANSSPDLTPEVLMGYSRKYHYKDVSVWIVWQYGGQYGQTCESAGIKRGDLLELIPSSDNASDPNSISIYWKEQHIGFMKENRMQGMVHDWKKAGLPVQAVVSFVGGESKLLVEFAFYGTPSTPHPNTKKEKRT